MSDYPNREHKNADEAALRRALAAVTHILDEAIILRGRLENRHISLDGDDSQRIASLARDLTQHLSILGALREVREWDAADRAERRTDP